MGDLQSPAFPPVLRARLPAQTQPTRAFNRQTSAFPDTGAVGRGWARKPRGADVSCCAELMAGRCSAPSAVQVIANNLQDCVSGQQDLQDAKHFR